tara:strand:- start:39 stop:380 length:342 start_codon:yes stop_codon:yes gene_type:complete
MKKIEVTITRSNGSETQTIDGYQVFDCIAVHRSLFGSRNWSATHLPTGGSLGYYASTRKKLVERLEICQGFHPVEWQTQTAGGSPDSMLGKFWRVLNSTRANCDLVSDDSWRN